MLKIKNLYVSVKKKQILKGVNLTINKGEIHVIMGPNGSGKSTLASIIAGKKDYTINKGNLIFENINLNFFPPEERAHLGIFLSFQDPIEIPGISILNFIRISINSIRKANGKKELSYNEFFKKVKMVSDLLKINRTFLSRYLNEGFSGGEKKRNEIFQMCMINPKLSILDEIDSGLDIDAIRTISRGIHQFKKNNNSILIITHYQRLLNYIVPDYVHIFYKGKLVKSGNKELAIKIESEGYDWIKN
ncbi:Fe-S cluster assembly ATPase SufC [Candidatus Karelsulcia muelleri]|uniref:Fe-S cluster assembly ATPase SufC n=1 Tax=Candidatus Karelsulcia muelleri TaxID=336810 RepID=UPI00216AE203|nr:Fe-S cluster assembly ATPase SufC [Candidatus Karelsulcia muelleri]